MYDFDLLVIGAGSGGVRAARMAAESGARVAVAEDRYLGGTCVNVGCIPKKLYSLAAHYRYDFEDSAGFGWDLAEPRFDWNRLRTNKQQEIRRLNGIYEGMLARAGATLLNGRGVLKDAHTVEIDGATHTARYLLVATGGWPRVPEFPGNDLVLTSNEIFDLPRFPSRVLIIGGGYIAVEFAGIFAGLGAETLLSYRGDMPLKHFDEAVRGHYFMEAEKHVRMLMNTEVASITKTDGALLVLMKDGTGHQVDAVLLATGRKPNIAGLGLDKVGVALAESGHIEVDEHFRTNVESIYALGDVVGRLELTPVALAEGMVLANHLFGDKTRKLSYANIATAVFSHPNIATVGLKETEASEKYAELLIFESHFRELRHTLSGRDERTYMKVIVDKASDRVLGMHMVGPHAGEIIQGFAAAMTCAITKAQLDATIGIHPTLAEEFVTMRSVSRRVGAQGAGMVADVASVASIAK